MEGCFPYIECGAREADDPEEWEGIRGARENVIGRALKVKGGEHGRGYLDRAKGRGRVGKGGRGGVSYHRLCLYPLGSLHRSGGLEGVKRQLIHPRPDKGFWNAAALPQMR